MGIFLILIGILSVAYGATVMAIHSGVHFFVVWYGIGAACIALGCSIYLGFWEMLPAWIGGAVALGLAVICICFVVLGLKIMHAAHQDVPAGLDFLIVLGAQVRSSGEPSYALRYRLDSAVRYLKENPSTRCVISGGQGANEPCSEAACMHAFLTQQGIASSRILDESTSTTTVENLRFSMQTILEQASDKDRSCPYRDFSFGIVTNDFHVYRALAIARKQGIEHAFGIAAYSTPWYLPNNVFRECLGIVKNKLTDNI